MASCTSCFPRGVVRSFTRSSGRKTSHRRSLLRVLPEQLLNSHICMEQAASDDHRIGAGESVFRWLIMPRLVELQNLAGSVRLEFLTKNTTQSVESVKAGHLDLGIVRKEAAGDSLSVLPCGSLAYALVVPRKLLPGRTAAGFQLLQKLPFALLSGDGALAKGVLALAAKLNVKLDIRVRAESFSLLVSAIESADLRANVRRIAPRISALFGA